MIVFNSPVQIKKGVFSYAEPGTGHQLITFTLVQVLQPCDFQVVYFGNIQLRFFEILNVRWPQHAPEAGFGNKRQTARFITGQLKITIPEFRQSPTFGLPRALP